MKATKPTQKARWWPPLGAVAHPLLDIRGQEGSKSKGQQKRTQVWSQLGRTSQTPKLGRQKKKKKRPSRGIQLKIPEEHRIPRLKQTNKKLLFNEYLKNKSTPYGFNMTMERFVYLGLRHISWSCAESEKRNPPSSCQRRVAQLEDAVASPGSPETGNAGPALFSDLPWAGITSGLSPGSGLAGAGPAPPPPPPPAPVVSLTTLPRAPFLHAIVLVLLKRQPGVLSSLGDGLGVSGLLGSTPDLMWGQQ